MDSVAFIGTEVSRGHHRCRKTTFEGEQVKIVSSWFQCFFAIKWIVNFKNLSNRYLLNDFYVSGSENMILPKYCP